MSITSNLFRYLQWDYFLARASSYCVWVSDSAERSSREDRLGDNNNTYRLRKMCLVNESAKKIFRQVLILLAPKTNKNEGSESLPKCLRVATALEILKRLLPVSEEHQ